MCAEQANQAYQTLSTGSQTDVTGHTFDAAVEANSRLEATKKRLRITSGGAYRWKAAGIKVARRLLPLAAISSGV